MCIHPIVGGGGGGGRGGEGGQRVFDTHVVVSLPSVNFLHIMVTTCATE